MLYVSACPQGRGIESVLYRQVEAVALRDKLARLYAEASLIAGRSSSAVGSAFLQNKRR